MKYDVVDILVVEDNDSERASNVFALQNAILDVDVVAVRGRDEAMDFLHGRRTRTERTGGNVPSLFLLDLAQPIANGISWRSLRFDPYAIGGQWTTEEQVEAPYRTSSRNPASMISLAGRIADHQHGEDHEGSVLRNRVVSEPHNLAKGWVGFDFEFAVGCPVKLVSALRFEFGGHVEKSGGKYRRQSRYLPVLKGKSCHASIDLSRL
jgi:CheY-like chemotaxis protein